MSPFRAEPELLTPRTKLPCNDLWALEYAYGHIFFLKYHLFLEYWSRNRSPYKVCSTSFLLRWKGTAGRALCFHQGATASENRKSNTPPIFHVTSISHNCVSYPPIYSCSTQCEGKRYRSHHLSHSSGGLSRGASDLPKTWGGCLRWELIPTTDSTSGNNASSDAGGPQRSFKRSRS